MSRKKDETLLESPENQTPTPPPTPEEEKQALQRINHGCLIFEFHGKIHRVRWPKGNESLIAQRKYSVTFYQCSQEGVPSLAQLDMEKILPLEQWERFQQRDRLIQAGLYDYEAAEKLEDWEREVPAEIDNVQVAAAKIRLNYATLLGSPSTVLYLNNTAETMAQNVQNFYLTWAVTETQNKYEKWVRPWSTYEEFMEEPEPVVEFFNTKREELMSEEFDFLSESPPIATSGDSNGA